MQIQKLELDYKLNAEITITMYYLESLEDLLTGISVDVLLKQVEGYLGVENYLACEGIKRAIYKHKQIQVNNGI